MAVEYTVGIDLGGTNIVAGVVKRDTRKQEYEIIAKADCKTAIPRPEADVCDSMADIVKQAIKKAKLTMDDIAYIGIGVPGAVNPETRIVETSPNLFFTNWEISKMMEERLNKYVKIENDANAAALGEFLAGAAKGCKNAVVVTLGTGVGGGIIIDGKIYSGSNFAGAELGHMVIVKDGKKCGCGRRGCWEAYASATALINQTKDAIRNEKAEFSFMLDAVEGDIEQVNGKTPFDAYLAGDLTGKAVINNYVSFLACGIVNVINIFQPDILCVGGGISKQGETLLAPVRAIVEQERITKHNEKQTQICECILGNDAGIIGAACL